MHETSCGVDPVRLIERLKDFHLLPVVEPVAYCVTGVDQLGFGAVDFFDEAHLSQERLVLTCDAGRRRRGHGHVRNLGGRF